MPHILLVPFFSGHGVYPFVTKNRFKLHIEMKARFILLYCEAFGRQFCEQLNEKMSASARKA